VIEDNEEFQAEYEKKGKSDQMQKRGSIEIYNNCTTVS